MPVIARLGLVALVLVGWRATVQAQEVGSERFFADTPADEDDPQSTTYDGSLTSTSFYYREDGDQGEPLRDGSTGPLSASPVDRLFTDVRGQLTADHIGGSKVDFRADLRGRYTTTYVQQPPPEADGNEIPFQSGTFHGNEFELRELYVRRDGAQVDLSIGRQYSLELAATKFDGVKIERQAGTRWKAVVFAGLYPSRISRDIREDYPPIVADEDLVMPGLQPGKRITPVAGGVGTGYRFQRAYGAFGAVGILPLADDKNTPGTLEKPRVFATANGYWRQSSTVDVYHYLVFDALGVDGAALTNFTVGLNLQPTQTFRVYGNVNHTDTETLNVVAQSKLEDPDPEAPPVVQNNIDVQRIAQDSARAGLSVELRNRFEVSPSAALRRRGELRIAALDQMEENEVVLPAAQAADLTLSLVDRRSWLDTRIGLSATRSFGVGDAGLDRTSSFVARLDATRELADGKAELEGSFTYLTTADDNRGTACDFMDPQTCYGAANMQSFTVGGLVFYRFQPTWFLIASATAGRQDLEAADAAGKLQAQPAVLSVSFLLRLAYRF